MNLELRLELEKDYRETEIVTREAFWDVYKPGCDEHLLLHKLRRVTAFVRELDFVAVHDGQIIGNVVYTRAKIVGSDSHDLEVLCLGPVCVLPSFQKKGVGTALIQHSLREARGLGHRAVVLFGNPQYYSRFGFKSARSYHLKSADGFDGDPFMALELYEGALQGSEGTFHEDPVFRVDKAELEAFEREFPYKEKHTTSTQL